MKKRNIFLAIAAFLLFQSTKAQTVIKMKKEGGVFTIPCSVNGIKLKFIFDTGASDVSISLTEALFMLKNGYLSNEDITGKQYYSDATGRISVGTTIILRKIEFSGLTLYNVRASIVNELNAPLLLGQSAMSKFGKFEIDPNTGILTILNGPQTSYTFDIDTPNTSESFSSTIKGVNVEFNYTVSIFPEDWQQAPISAYGEKLSSEEVSRTKKIAIKALSKYPLPVLQTNLVAVYFLKQMKFYNVGYGGTNSNDAVYLTNNGIAMGYTDKYLEQTFHHEFSSILFRNFPALLDTNKWKNANQPEFSYNDPENGVGAIRNNQSSQALDTLFSKKGMLTQYATSSIENDVNTFAQNLFCPEKDFWLFVDRYPSIRKKATLLISFYNKINTEFTEQYFSKLGTQ